MCHAASSPALVGGQESVPARPQRTPRSEPRCRYRYRIAVAVLNDIHGNLPALEATLADVDRERLERIVCGGDLLSGPYQSECLALLRERQVEFLVGNADREVLQGEGEQNAWCLDRLSPEEREFVATWPFSVELGIAGLGVVFFCHASPRSDSM